MVIIIYAKQFYAQYALFHVEYVLQICLNMKNNISSVFVDSIYLYI